MIKSYPKEKDRITVDEFRNLKVKPDKSLAALKKDLDKVFNAWIRRRDTITGGVFLCISCGGYKDTKQMNAGHYFSAGHNQAVRWNEFNCNGQCVFCNLHLHGNFEGYTKGILKKYGAKVLEDLKIQRHNQSRMMKFEVQFLIETYKAKLATK